MRLADFIERNTNSILTEWEIFARSIWPRAAGDPVELRDHAEEILHAAVKDMSATQSDEQRSDKSKGTGDHGAGSRRLNVASTQHGIGRVESGFKIMAMVSEYRALRASVIHLWRESRPNPDLRDIDDLTRFNESIDQSLTEAIAGFTERVDRSRQLFLAILGHDLRNPLGAMLAWAGLLKGTPDARAETAETARVITSSAEAMSRMISDLLDFTGSGLGGGLPLTPAAADLGRVCHEVIDETRAAHPNCTVHYDPAGDLTGHWDAARLRQVVSNLLGNAVQHGAEACLVNLSARGEGDDVVLAFVNGGPPIPPDALTTIFDPLVRIASPELQKRRRPGSVGLGRFIAREVVAAHGGTIDATSSADAGTTFTVRLPRRPRGGGGGAG